MIVMQVCDAIEKVLLHQVIKLGNDQEIIDSFVCMGFPNVRVLLMEPMCLFAFLPPDPNTRAQDL